MGDKNLQINNKGVINLCEQTLFQVYVIDLSQRNNLSLFEGFQSYGLPIEQSQVDLSKSARTNDAHQLVVRDQTSLIFDSTPIIVGHPRRVECVVNV